MKLVISEKFQRQFIKTRRFRHYIEPDPNMHVVKVVPDSVRDAKRELSRIDGFINFKGE